MQKFRNKIKNTVIYRQNLDKRGVPVITRRLCRLSFPKRICWIAFTWHRKSSAGAPGFLRIGSPRSHCWEAPPQVSPKITLYAFLVLERCKNRAVIVPNHLEEQRISLMPFSNSWNWFGKWFLPIMLTIRREKVKRCHVTLKRWKGVTSLSTPGKR